MKSEKNTKKNLVDFLNGSFFAIPRSALLARKKMRRASSFIIQDYLFAYFSSETGQRIGYKHFFTQQLAKELEISRSVFIEGLREVEESGIFKVFDFEHKGKIVFLQNEFTKDLIDKLESNKLFINIDMRLNINISDKKLDEKIINFPCNEVKQIQTLSVANPDIKCSESRHLVSEIQTLSVANPDTLTNAGSFDWSNWEADLKKTQEAYTKEAIYKESYSYHIEAEQIETQTFNKNENEMNDDINKKIEKKEEDKISNFYLEEMIDLGIYDYKAKEYISKLSTNHIQKAFDKLEAAKDSGHYIKNEGNFIREALEAMIDPNFKPKFSIQEKEQIILNIPEPIRKDNPNELEIKLNQYLEFFMPNITKVIHNFDTKIDEFNKKVVDKFNLYILESYTEDPELNQNRARFIDQIKELKRDSNNKVKEILLLSYRNPILNKKNEDGKKILDVVIDWFESI